MRVLAVLAVALGLGAGAIVAAPAMSGQGGVRIGQPAPEIAGSPWINSEPLSMEKLRGRVVYVEFWTYG
jgi:hypothetical protein